MAFLVIEGLDGSGKSTQVKLLREYLEDAGKEYRYIHFPRTESGVFGELISMFLRGDLGKIDAVNPYLVALLYAADRNDAKADMLEWLSEGKLLVADRYVVSNIAFQCAKMETGEQKKQLAGWICHLEYTHFGIPRPDLNIFLDVPSGFTRDKLRNNRFGSERGYLRGKSDIHETDLEFQKRVRLVYTDQAESDQSVKMVKCYDDNMAILQPCEIFGKVLELLKRENLIY